MSPNILNNLKSGAFIGLGFVGVLMFSGIVLGAWTNVPELKVESQNTLSSTLWNNVIDNLDYIKSRVDGGVAVPSGAVLSFNLVSCPIGWIPANGNNGTPDLRGKFIRGLNTFENGGNKLTGSDSDIDGASRILGSYQSDTIRNITGYIDGSVNAYGVNPPQGGALTSVIQGARGANGTNYQYNYINFDASRVVPTGSDNRPKNVALIYCVKE